MFIIKQSGTTNTKRPSIRKDSIVRRTNPLLKANLARKQKDAEKEELTNEEIKDLKKLASKVDKLLEILEPKEKTESKNETEEESFEEELDEPVEEEESDEPIEEETDFDEKEEKVMSYGDSKKTKSSSFKHIGAIMNKAKDSKETESYEKQQVEAYANYYKSLKD